MSATLACAGEGIPDPAGPDPACTDEPPFRASLSCIQQFVFTPTCAVPGCHLDPAAQEGMDLSDGRARGSLVGVPSTQAPLLLRVEPGDPDGSYLLLKLEGRPGILGERMPSGGPYLTPEELDVFRRWIFDGAPDE